MLYFERKLSEWKEVFRFKRAKNLNFRQQIKVSIDRDHFSFGIRNFKQDVCGLLLELKERLSWCFYCFRSQNSVAHTIYKVRVNEFKIWFYGTSLDVE